MKLFTTDRESRLSNKVEIPLITTSVLPDDVPAELKSHLNDLYPKGLSLHGLKYFVSRGIYIKNLGNDIVEATPSVLIDVLFEYVRKCDYPDKTSRFQSLFAFGSLDDVNRFKVEFGIPANAPVWEIEADTYHKVDMHLLKLPKTGLQISQQAHKYWNGEASDDPFWEYLVPLPVKIGQKIS